jgi:hypothetical protein
VFDRYIGIDYSGAKSSNARPSGRGSRISVFDATLQQPSPIQRFPMTGRKNVHHWSRRELAAWLLNELRTGTVTVVGIDHAFSLPISYFQSSSLQSWDDFLPHLRHKWPTAGRAYTVEKCLTKNGKYPTKDLRITETWVSAAKSALDFDRKQGQVAKSTHAGIPWLAVLRRAFGKTIHFWPFDGWTIPPNKSVIVEVYPAILKHRFPSNGIGPDEHDARSIAAWMADRDKHSLLARYFAPALTQMEQKQAMLEGWILGIM